MRQDPIKLIKICESWGIAIKDQAKLAGYFSENGHEVLAAQQAIFNVIVNDKMYNVRCYPATSGIQGLAGLVDFWIMDGSFHMPEFETRFISTKLCLGKVGFKPFALLPNDFTY